MITKLLSILFTTSLLIMGCGSSSTTGTFGSGRVFVAGEVLSASSQPLVNTQITYEVGFLNCAATSAVVNGGLIVSGAIKSNSAGQFSNLLEVVGISPPDACIKITIGQQEEFFIEHVEFRSQDIPLDTLKVELVVKDDAI